MTTIVRNLWIPLLAAILLLSACAKVSKPESNAAKTRPEATQPSAIKVETSPGGPVVLTTATAQFQVTPDGYVEAALLKDGKKLSLDEPPAGMPADSDFARIGGKDVHLRSTFNPREFWRR